MQEQQQDTTTPITQSSQNPPLGEALAAKQFAETLQKWENRLILACLPSLLLIFVLLAIGSAYPQLSTLINLIVTIFIVPITFIIGIRLGEIALRWGHLVNHHPGDEGFHYALGVAGIAILLFLGAAALLQVVSHANSENGTKLALLLCIALILLFQYRLIIQRYLQAGALETSQEHSDASSTHEK